MVPAHPKGAGVEVFTRFDGFTQDEVTRDRKDDLCALFCESGRESRDHIAQATDFGPRRDLCRDHKDAKTRGRKVALFGGRQRHVHQEALSILPWET